MTETDVVLNPAGLVRHLPLKPEQLQSRIIPQRDMFVLAHIGIPQVDIKKWTLEVCGEVATPLRLTYEDLRQFPRHTVESFHQCAGFPRRPDLPTRRIVNVVWGGARVCDVAAAAGVKANARYLWAYGLDRGPFEGKPDHYAKDLPLQRQQEASWMLAYEVNGEPLTPEHGFPVRLVAPGFYGTNCVKWVSRIEFAEQRCPGTFTQVLYNDPVKGSEERRPVWEAGPESLIVAPHDRAQLASGRHEIWGWAWGSRPIARVEVSCNGGGAWTEARVEPRRQWSWQKFSLPWEAVGHQRAELRARATDEDGNVQPDAGARNAVHCIAVTVTA